MGNFMITATVLILVSTVLILGATESAWAAAPITQWTTTL